MPLLSLTSFIMKSNAFPESSRQISSQSYWLELVHMAHSSPLQQKMQGTQEEEAMTAHGHPRQYQDVRSREEAGSGCQVDNQPLFPQVAWPFTTWMFYLYLLFFLNPKIQAPLWVCSESQSMTLSPS